MVYMKHQDERNRKRDCSSPFWTAEELEHPAAIMYEGRIVEFDDIPENMRDVAEVLGLKFVLDLASILGGSYCYIPPLKTIYIDARDREIRRRFNGGNYAALAVQYRMTERYIRKIVHGQRPRDKRKQERLRLQLQAGDLSERGV